MVSIVFEAGNDMEMEMRDDLAGDFPVGLVDVDSIGPEAFLLGLGDPADHGNDLGQNRVRGLGQGVVMGLRDDQA